MGVNPIQWFPGHMAKTKRLMQESLKEVDFIIELVDARIPYSSKNPEIDKIIGDKPRITLLTKATLANPEITARWVEYYKSKNKTVAVIDAVSGLGISEMSEKIRLLMKDKLERYKEKGMQSRHLRSMIVGIPNVGKSSLINRLAGAKKAKVEDRPGVTLNKQWVPTDMGFDLLDMPGVLWPKFEDEDVGLKLAITGAIRDKIIDTEEIAMCLCQKLMEHAKEEFLERYKLTEEETDGLDGYDLFELVGRKRGFLMSGGRINGERTATTLLDEFRGGVIGRISLEKP